FDKMAVQRGTEGILVFVIPPGQALQLRGGVHEVGRREAFRERAVNGRERDPFPPFPPKPILTRQFTLLYSAPQSQGRRNRTCEVSEPSWGDRVRGGGVKGRVRAQRLAQGLALTS